MSGKCRERVTQFSSGARALSIDRTLIELAVKAAESTATPDPRAAAVLERLRAVQNNLCADPKCHLLCKAGCQSLEKVA